MSVDSHFFCAKHKKNENIKILPPNPLSGAIPVHGTGRDSGRKDVDDDGPDHRLELI